MNTNLTFDFATYIDRTPEDSVKWGKFKGRDILPFWVADMDFRAAPAILQALFARVEYGVLGYGETPHELSKILAARLQRLYNWKTEPSKMIWKTGMVPFLYAICRIFAGPHHKVIVPVPIYYHLHLAPPHQGMELIAVPYQAENQSFKLDLNAIEAGLKSGARLILLCNPFNPIGRVMPLQELLDLGALAEKYDSIIVSDEIHAELILDKAKKHIPVASLNGSLKNRTITLMGPTKTFNIPGLGISCAYAENADIHARLLKGVTGPIPAPDCLAVVAATAAYQHGDSWLSACLEYLRQNQKIVAQFFHQHPEYILTEPMDATYLAWVKAPKIPSEKMLSTFEAVGVGISDGAQFKADGYFRFNFACHLSTLNQGLERISILRL